LQAAGDPGVVDAGTADDGVTARRQYQADAGTQQHERRPQRLITGVGM
jgi:hypothetical protein